MVLRTDYADRELDQFIAARVMGQKGAPCYTADITQAWHLVERMVRKYYCELKMDMFLGVSGEHWVVSFYSPRKCKRYESKGKTAPLAICRAAKEAFVDLVGG
jgi:hypothetical protein